MLPFGHASLPASPAVDNGLEPGERGYRRSKLAALAGSLYRSGQQAVTEIRETYAQTRARDLDGSVDTPAAVDIPRAFPDVPITACGEEQMILFPCYAKQHVRRRWGPAWDPQCHAPPDDAQDEQEYLQMQRERELDERAVVDVDVRGWIYAASTGPMSRRNRYLVGLARQLSGIPAPRAAQASDDLDAGAIAQEAAKIERVGREEQQLASKGAYSDRANLTTTTMPTTTTTTTTTTTSAAMGVSSELSEEEVAAANANLMARIAPFMTSPLAAHDVVIFFYDGSRSQSRTVATNEAGHFSVRAALDFLPTHFKVLANERLSTTQEVRFIAPAGVSLISDIDDTVKTSNITGGARDMFRSTFVRELADMTVEGVREWYGGLAALGVSVHYCSASPWQLFPMLATYLFALAGLPPGSLHLKHYSGMLQGIFQPVAERKRDTLARLLRDFPHRRFLLVGDSGEADLEVYTELALTHPGRVLAVLIRDVTTPAGTPYLEPSLDLARQGVAGMALNDGGGGGNKVRQNSAPGVVGGSDPRRLAGPVMGTLIDFSTEPEEQEEADASALQQLRESRPGASVSTADLLARKPPPPPRPTKPAALCRAPTSGPGMVARVNSSPSTSTTTTTTTVAAPTASSSSLAGAPPPPPPPPPRRRATPSSSSKSLSRGHSANADVEPLDQLPPSLDPPLLTSISSLGPGRSATSSPSPSGSPSLAAANKKLELWRRRLFRAQEQLAREGVALYTWRKGQDVEAETRGIVERALAEIRR